MTASFDVVIPTTGRASLGALLESLALQEWPRAARVLIVHDVGAEVDTSVDELVPERLAGRVTVLRSSGSGPAAARNLGWRASTAPWVVFVDDDVIAREPWLATLCDDLLRVPARVAGSQGRIDVPVPDDRAPTDWERNVKGLEGARFITADMAYRRSVLEEVGGFDERFTRAYREDADLALRVRAAGYRIVGGRRRVSHPPGRADRWVSVRLQRGNADDVLMRALHGSSWRAAAGAPRGRLARHAVTTTAGLAFVAASLSKNKAVAAASAAGWAGGTAELAWARIAPGPRSSREIQTMLATSALIPPAATFWWIYGIARRRRLLADTTRAPKPVLRVAESRDSAAVS